MWSNCHLGRSGAEGGQPPHRNAQLWLRATPKQIGRRRGNDQEVGPECLNRFADLLDREIVYLRVDKQRLVPGNSDLVEGKQ